MYLHFINTSLDRNIQNDQIQVHEQNFFSDVRGRNTVEAHTVYDCFPEIKSVPKSLKMPFEQILNKPYLAKVITWPSSASVNTNLVTMRMPYDFLVNPQLEAPFFLAAKYRLKACLYLQVTGTPLHAGMLIASVLPTNCINPTLPGVRNSYMQAPHVFLSANEATPVCLEVPFYSNTKLLETNPNNFNNAYNGETNYAELQINVWNQLNPATSSSTSLSVSIHVVFTDAEFYIPKNESTTWVPQSTMVSSIMDMAASAAKKLTGDFIDNVRNTVRKYTGLHNPNIPIIQERMLAVPRNLTNNVDIPTYFEKLDPYADHNRNVVEPTFYTDCDEMDIKNIISKPQYIGTFTVTTGNNTGDVLWSRPITPAQEQVVPPAFQIGSPLQVFSLLTKFWKGGIKLHIQSVMTNFHNVRIMVARNYSNDVRALTNVPSFADVVALQTSTLEYSGGSQVQTIRLEYCSEFEQLPNTISAVTNALSHGMYYIYLAQPLVTSAQVATSVDFNVYISADDDFEFYGYSTHNLQPLARVGALGFEPQSVMVEPSSQEDLTNKVKESNPDSPKNFRPVVSTREFIRRFAQVAVYDTSTIPRRPNEYDTRVIKVSDLFNRYCAFSSSVTNNSVNFQRIVRQFYLGHTGGLKFKFHFYNAQDATVKYVPPTMYLAKEASPTYGVETFAEPSDNTTYAEWISRNNYPYDDTLVGDVMSPPFIETGTWTKPYVSLPDNVASETMSTSQIQIECVIPNMNNVEFIGDKTWFQDTSSTTGAGPFTSTLGSFVLTVLARNSNEQTVPNIRSRCVIYMSYADEARMGFNVCAPVVRIPALLPSTDPVAIDYEYVYDGTNYIATNQVTTMYTGAYIGGAN